MNKKQLNALLERMHEALEAMDAVSDGEDQSEICAETEDFLFFIESVDLNDEDAQEEINDTLEEMIDMLSEVEGDDEFAETTSVMRKTAEFAKLNL